MKRVSKKIIIPFFVVGALCLTLALLSFGNPRRSRWIYVFQAYVFPGPPDRLISPPKDYVGTWIDWGPSGNKLSEQEWKKGKMDGQITSWHPNGTVRLTGSFRSNRLHGTWIKYNDRGMPVSEQTHVDEQRILEKEDQIEQPPAGDVLKAAPEK